MPRVDGRRSDELRPVKIIRHYTKWAEGSVLIQSGDTWVVCTASVEERVPPFLRGTGQGWVTAEYGMLPRSTSSRTQREVSRGRVAGRTSEIQRLIGRALRSVVDLRMLGEKTVWIDCDVLQADGGTRTASITGGFVAMVEALARLAEQERWDSLPVYDYVAAVSVGMVDGELLLDLCFQEDSRAAVDMNVVMTGTGEFVEIQGTAEGDPFGARDLEAMLQLGRQGVQRLIELQKEALSPDLAGQIGTRPRPVISGTMFPSRIEE